MEGGHSAAKGLPAQGDLALEILGFRFEGFGEVWVLSVCLRHRYFRSKQTNRMKSKSVAD